MEKFATDELQTLATEAGFDKLDENELFDVVFGGCSCCCYVGGGGGASC